MEPVPLLGALCVAAGEAWPLLEALAVAQGAVLALCVAHAVEVPVSAAIVAVGVEEKVAAPERVGSAAVRVAQEDAVALESTLVAVGERDAEPVEDVVGGSDATALALRLPSLGVMLPVGEALAAAVARELCEGCTGVAEGIGVSTGVTVLSKLLAVPGAVAL